MENIKINITLLKDNACDNKNSVIFATELFNLCG
jgi:hypothetical protein